MRSHVMLAALTISCAFTANNYLRPLAADHVRTAAPVAEIGRRDAIAAASFTAAASVLLPLQPALADVPQIVTVAGATGQTGRRIVERLVSKNVAVVGGVRDVEKAKKSLAESSTVVRGAMMYKVRASDVSAVSLTRLDVEKDSVATLTETLKGSDALIIATGFVPGNPFKMDAAAHAVDNLGTIALVDAAKAAGWVARPRLDPPSLTAETTLCALATLRAASERLSWSLLSSPTAQRGARSRRQGTW